MSRWLSDRIKPSDTLAGPSVPVESPVEHVGSSVAASGPGPGGKKCVGEAFQGPESLKFPEGG